MANKFTHECTRCGDSSNEDLCPKCADAYHAERYLLDQFYEPNPKSVAGIRLLLEGLKETFPDLDFDNHFTQTPYRVARMFTELCWGCAVDPQIHLKTAFEESNYNGIVLVKDISFTSLCAHHFAIFRGIAHVGYIPDGRIVGLSKINRVVEILAARPQVQERLTYQIAQTIEENLKPKGVAVILQGTHDCIEVRGVRSKGSITKTSDMRGIILSNEKNCKDEFMSLLNN